MQRLFAAILAATITLGAGAALANMAMGVVDEVDLANHTVTFENGHVFIFPANVDLSHISPGDYVAITYPMSDARTAATAISIEEPEEDDD
jgi:hypothetical protein